MKDSSKAIIAWFGTGFSWLVEKLHNLDFSQTAGLLTCIYTLLLIGDWVWKKVRGK